MEFLNIVTIVWNLLRLIKLRWPHDHLYFFVRLLVHPMNFDIIYWKIIAIRVMEVVSRSRARWRSSECECLLLFSFYNLRENWISNGNHKPRLFGYTYIQTYTKSMYFHGNGVFSNFLNWNYQCHAFAVSHAVVVADPKVLSWKWNPTKDPSSINR